MAGKVSNPPEPAEKPQPSPSAEDEYWEEMLGISKGPKGWNFSCG